MKLPGTNGKQIPTFQYRFLVRRHSPCSPLWRVRTRKYRHTYEQKAERTGWFRVTPTGAEIKVALWPGATA